MKICVCVHMCMCVHTCFCVCASVYGHVCACVSMSVHVHMYVYMCMCACIHTCVYTTVCTDNSSQQNICPWFLITSFSLVQVDNMLQVPQQLLLLLLLLFSGCLRSQQHASVSKEWMCSDICTCCHTKTKVADQTSCLNQSQYTDSGPTSPSADPIMPGTWQASHCICKSVV